MTFGNMEGNLADLDRFDGPLRGMMGDRDVAPSLKAMGFDLMSRANNHVFDSDQEGMYSTMEELDNAGIVHAGTGKNLEDARAPAFFDSPKGRVGLVGDARTAQRQRTSSGATYRTGQHRRQARAEPAEPDRLLPRDRRAALGDQGRSGGRPTRRPRARPTSTRLPDAASEPADRVQFLGVWYKVGTPGTRSFEMDESDLRENLRSIRNGKYLSEFMIATCHCHQGPITAQQWLFEDQTPDFLVELAHQSIDNGADMFVSAWSARAARHRDLQGEADLLRHGRVLLPVAAHGRRADVRLVVARARRVRDSDVAEAVCRRHVAADQLREHAWHRATTTRASSSKIRLYPTSGAWDGPVSQLGLPRTAPPAMAQKILARVQAVVEAVRHHDRDREQRRHHPHRPEPGYGLGRAIANGRRHDRHRGAAHDHAR